MVQGTSLFAVDGLSRSVSTTRHPCLRRRLRTIDLVKTPLYMVAELALGGTA